MKVPWLLAPVVLSVFAVREAPVEWKPAHRVPALTIEIRELDGALARGDVETAVRAWERANRAATASGRWEDLIEVGDAARHVEEIEGVPDGPESRARGIYLAALSRARQQGSLDGVLRAADAFARLGDHEGVEQSLRAAEALATFDAEAQADVRAIAKRSRTCCEGVGGGD